MVLFPHESESCSWEAQSSNSSATSQVVESMGAKHCGRSWEKNSCSFLNKTGKEIRGVLRFGAGLLEYLSSQQQCRFLQKTEEQERRTPERAREAAGARTNSSESKRRMGSDEETGHLKIPELWNAHLVLL